MLLNKGHDKAVDWWAFGVLLYEMLVGTDPFGDEEPIAVYQKILSGRIAFPRSFSRDAKSLIKRLLQVDLSKRIGNLKRGVEDIKNHIFFADFSWADCLEQRIHPEYQPVFQYFRSVKSVEIRWTRATSRSTRTPPAGSCP